MSDTWVFYLRSGASFEITPHDNDRVKIDPGGPSRYPSVEIQIDSPQLNPYLVYLDLSEVAAIIRKPWIP